MTLPSDLSLHAAASVSDLTFPTMRQLILHEARSHDLPVLEDSGACLSLDATYGVLTFRALDTGVSITVSANQPDWLYMLKDGFLEHLSHSAPDTVANLRWDDAQKVGGLPVNFQFAKVISVRPVGTAFLRVLVRSRDLHSFDDTAIHFRLVLPQPGQDRIEWPHVGENGATVWPTGDNALHRPVYTSRWVDHAAGEMAIDIFEHDGGRATEWARTAQPGDQVALVGPGGGGVPDTDRILMFADETAFPAVARITESLPEHTRGHVALIAQDGAQCAYPITTPVGVSVSWHAASDMDAFADLALSMHAKDPDHFLWFAAEKAPVQKVRAAYKAQGGDPTKSYIAGYWINA